MKNRVQTNVRKVLSTKPRTASTAAVAVATIGVLTLTAPPAFAGYAYDYLDNGRGYGHVDGTYVSACDTKADNRGVVTEFRWGNGYEDHVSDGNGSGAGCGSYRTSSDIYSFRVCLQNPGSTSIDYCKSWKSV